MEHDHSEIISAWVTDLHAALAAGVDTPSRADAVSRILDEAACDADALGVTRDAAPGSLDARFTESYERLAAELERAYRRDDVYAQAVSRARSADADDTLCSFGWKLVPVDPDLAAVVLHDSAPRQSSYGVACTYRWVYDALAAANHELTSCEPHLPADALDVAARLWDPYDRALGDFADVFDLVAAVATH
jgi:hypothetical protein